MHLNLQFTVLLIEDFVLLSDIFDLIPESVVLCIELAIFDLDVGVVGWSDVGKTALEFELHLLLFGLLKFHADVLHLNGGVLDDAAVGNVGAGRFYRLIARLFSQQSFHFICLQLKFIQD